MANDVSDSSRPEFWNGRFAEGRTPWDFRGVPEALTRFLHSATPARVLIPGCGRGYEIEAFHRAGWDVAAIDFSPAAVEIARKALGSLGSRIVLGDFFGHDFGEGAFDLVYERTFLCAIPPRLWSSYARRVARLLRPGGALAGFFLYGEEANPPPFPLSEAEAIRLFGEHFRLRVNAPVQDSLPLFAGRERWQEWRRTSQVDTHGRQAAKGSA